MESEDQGKVNLSFNLNEGMLAIMLMLDRIEARQEVQLKMLGRLLVKADPEVNLEEYNPFQGEIPGELLKSLQNIESEVNMIKHLLKSSNNS